MFKYQMLSFAIRMDTRQFNFRISKGILFDLEFISRVTELDKGEWVRYKLAEAIRKEKEKLISELEKNFVQCRIDIKKFKELTGYEPHSSLIIAREGVKKKREEFELAIKEGRHGEFARDALFKGTRFKRPKKR